MSNFLRYFGVSVGIFFTVVLVYDAFKIFRALRASAASDMRSIPYSASPARERARLLVVGDSTAVGTGASDARQTVAGRIDQDVADLFIENKGVVGALTGELKAQLAAASSDPFDAILVQVGGNDILQWTSLEEVRTNLDAVLEETIRRAPHVALIVPGMVGDAPAIPWPINHLLNHRARRVRQVCRDSAAHHGVHFVDLTRGAKERNTTAQLGPTEGYAPDGLHPSGEGYGRWYAALLMQTQLLDWLRGPQRPGAERSPL